MRRLRRSWYRHLRPWWTTYRFAFLGVVATVALVIGYLGVLETGNYPHIPDRLYRTIQLFGFGIENNSPNWQLDVARFLIPFTTAWAGLATLRGIFSEQWLRLRIRMMKNHTIVCGLGRTGTRITIGLWDEDFNVVAIDSAPLSPLVEEMRVLGVPVLVGDAKNEVLLRAAGAGRARRVIVVCGDDGLNADIALLAAAAGGRRSRPLEVIVHVIDPALCKLLRSAAIAGEAAHAVRLEFFNVFDVGPRVLLNLYGNLDTPSPHLVIVGAGDVGTAVLLEACRRWRRDSRTTPLPVTIVDIDADDKVDELRRTYPGLHEVCKLTGVTAADLTRIRLPATRRPPTTVVVCVDPDAHGVAVALGLRPIVGNATVVVATTERTGFAGLLGAGTSAWPELIGFGILDAACQPKAVLGGINEVMAQAFHAEYLGMREELAKDLHEEYAEGRPSVPHWEKLDESLKESNRQQADDIHNKLRLVGCRVIPDRDGTAALLKFTRAEIEEIAKAEHVRWVNERTADGWKPGDKDVQNKRSPYLVDWDELDAPTQNIDRKFAKSLPGVLAKAGFAIVRGDSDD